MSADGNWKITISTPMGPQEVTATINTQGGTFTGRTQSPMGDQDISGTVSGDTLAWTSEITKPMPMKLEFNVTVEGDTLSGTAKLGPFGNAPVKGQRV